MECIFIFSNRHISAIFVMMKIYIILLLKVGGLMAFFLGLSIVSILECFCYCCNSIGNRCSGETENEAEEREKWQQRLSSSHVFTIPESTIIFHEILFF